MLPVTSRPRWAAVVVFGSWVTLAQLGPAGCKCSSGPTSGAAGSASVKTLSSIASAIPMPPALIASVTNPRGLEPYAGPVGTVIGKITIQGDAPPRTQFRQKVPSYCSAVASTYEYVFRVGPENALADTIVAATEYDAFIPPKSEAVEVNIKGCAFSERTIPMTFGQRLDVKNLDAKPYMPHLEGSRNPALFAAIPGGQPIHMYPNDTGYMKLFDEMKHPWMRADVFVFRYSTHTVSKLDGTYRLEGLPVGNLKVGARHPLIRHSLEKPVEIKANETITVDFVVPFNAQTDLPGSPGPGGSGAPSSSAASPAISASSGPKGKPKDPNAIH